MKVLCCYRTKSFSKFKGRLEYMTGKCLLDFICFMCRTGRDERLRDYDDGVLYITNFRIIWLHSTKPHSNSFCIPLERIQHLGSRVRRKGL